MSRHCYVPIQPNQVPNDNWFVFRTSSSLSTLVVIKERTLANVTHVIWVSLQFRWWVFVTLSNFHYVNVSFSVSEYDFLWIQGKTDNHDPRVCWECLHWQLSLHGQKFASTIAWAWCYLFTTGWKFNSQNSPFMPFNRSGATCSRVNSKDGLWET